MNEPRSFLVFFFNDTATTEIYTLSLHDALPISTRPRSWIRCPRGSCSPARWSRSEEHTSELQSRENIVCRLLLEKKKINKYHCVCYLKKYFSYTYIPIYNFIILCSLCSFFKIEMRERVII